MHVRRRWIEVLLVAGLSVAGHAQAQPAGDAREAVARAAEALGGAERIRAVRTMRLRGSGHDAYQDGGSLITTEPTAPEKMTIITAYERVIDLVNDRTRVRAKQSRAFVFAARAMMEGRPIDQGLDGDVAFDTAADGASRRLSRRSSAAAPYGADCESNRGRAHGARYEQSGDEPPHGRGRNARRYRDGRWRALHVGRRRVDGVAAVGPMGWTAR